jgi:hypothetical protein
MNRNKNPQRTAPIKGVTKSVWSRFGAEPPSLGYEGKSVSQGSNLTVVTPTDLITGIVAYHTMIAIFNAGRNNHVATIFQFENTDGGAVHHRNYHTPYLNDSSITSARAVKSTVLISNCTQAMYRIPGIHVLRTSQRFMVGDIGAVSHSECVNIRNAIVSNPDTVVLDGSKPVEICNVPSSDTDYYKFQQAPQNGYATIFMDGSEASRTVNRPMTVTWVTFDTTKVPGLHPTNQTHKFDIYTEQRLKHSISAAISTQADHPKPSTAKAVVEAVEHSKHLGPVIHK